MHCRCQLTINGHTRGCPMKAFRHSDAAKRISDTWNLHRMGDTHGAIRKWFAARMDDGSTDNVLYDHKVEAVRHQHHNERYYVFLRIMPFTITACEAEVYLTAARKLYDAGLKMTDPDHRSGGPDLIKRVSWEDQFAQAMGHATNIIHPN